MPDGSVFNPNEGDNALKPPYSLVAAGRSKPRERKEYAAESSKAQANSSSVKLGPKDTKGKNRENPMFYEALSPDDQMPGDGLPRDKYIPMEDDDFSAFDLVVGKVKKAAKIKAEKIGAKKT